jgi:hypothetical protein
VELRSFEDAKGERRVALAVRSDLSIEAQATASGATWLDRQLVARDPVDLGGGFGLEVKQTMEARAAHLIQDGMARRDGERILFSRNLIGTLRQRELDALGDTLAAETGMPFQKSADGEFVAGTYSRRFALASGRFAMIDDGLGFKLVPWTPSIEKHIGQHISGWPAPTAASIGRLAASGDWGYDSGAVGLPLGRVLYMLRFDIRMAGHEGTCLHGGRRDHHHLSTAELNHDVSSAKKAAQDGPVVITDRGASPCADDL